MADRSQGRLESFFSIAITPRCWRERYYFHWIFPIILDPYLIILSVKQNGIKYYVWVFVMTRVYIYIYIYVYCISCKKCKLKYIGETSRDLHVRLKDHKRDIRNGNNAQFQHISQYNYNFDLSSEKMLIYIHNKRLRWIFTL